MSVRLIHGDALAVLRTLEPDSIDCCVTSPPYWALRDYGFDGQIGLEPSPEAWCARLVEVFGEVRRVLKPTGTLWVNCGDSYAGAGRGGNPAGPSSTLRGGTETQEQSRVRRTVIRRRDDAEVPRSDMIRPPGCKPKDLVGQAWMLAFALRDAGWYLRKDIIWHKPNPMPESCRDRPTSSHEYIFLLAKSERYFYDAGAIAEPCSPNTHARMAKSAIKTPDGWDTSTGDGGHGSIHKSGREKGRYLMPPIGGTKAPGQNGRATYSGNRPEFRMAPSAPKAESVEPGNHRGPRPKQNASFNAAVAGQVPIRNARSVWTIPTEPSSDRHFASFPQELARRCILAGCPVGGTVLDPFGGRGTVGVVATLTGRNAVLIDGSAEYIGMARRRLDRDCGLFAEVSPC